MTAPKAFSTAQDGRNTVLSVTVPSTTSAGDLITIRFATNTQPDTITVDGTYQIAEDGTQTGAVASILVWKIATASDAGSVVTATYGTQSRLTGMCVVMAAGDFDPAAPINATATADATQTSPAVTTTADGCTIFVWDVAQCAGTGFTFTPPSGFTNVALVETNKGAGKNNHQAVAYTDGGPAGTYGPYTSTWSTFDVGSSHTLAIAPAPSGGGGGTTNVSAVDSATSSDGVASLVIHRDLTDADTATSAEAIQTLTQHRDLTDTDASHNFDAASVYVTLTDGDTARGTDIVTDSATGRAVVDGDAVTSEEAASPSRASADEDGSTAADELVSLARESTAADASTAADVVLSMVVRHNVVDMVISEDTQAGLGATLTASEGLTGTETPPDLSAGLSEADSAFSEESAVVDGSDMRHDDQPVAVTETVNLLVEISASDVSTALDAVSALSSQATAAETVSYTELADLLSGRSVTDSDTAHVTETALAGADSLSPDTSTAAESAMVEAVVLRTESVASSEGASLSTALRSSEITMTVERATLTVLLNAAEVSTAIDTVFDIVGPPKSRLWHDLGGGVSRDEVGVTVTVSEGREATFTIKRIEG